MKEEYIKKVKFETRGRPRMYPLVRVISEKEALRRVNRGIINDTVTTRSWLREHNLGLSGHPKQKYTKKQSANCKI